MTFKLHLWNIKRECFGVLMNIFFFCMPNWKNPGESERLVGRIQVNLEDWLDQVF